MKKNFFILIIFCFILPIIAQTFPSDYVSRIWTASDGLPGNTITDIIQDENGYIYIGTYDGLVRFDGYEFVILNKNTIPDFKCVSARTVFEDSTGDMWIGSNDEGVARLLDDGIIMYTMDNGLPNNSIRDIVEDKLGNIWIGTASGIVYLSPEGDFVIPPGLERYGEDKALVVSLYCDTAGRIWLASSKPGGIYYYTDGLFTRYDRLDVYGNITVTTVSQDSTGALWFGLSLLGAVKVDDGIPELYNSNQGLEDITVNDIFRDNESSLWFGTEDGVFLYKEGKFLRYTEHEGLTNNNVKRVLQDREGNIWLATDRGGVEKMSMGKFRTQTLPTTVNCIAEDKNSTVWIGTDDGLLCYDRYKEIKNDLTEYCNKLRIRHVGIAKNGDVLVSTYNGKGQVRAGKDGIQNWTMKEGIIGNKVRVAIDDSKDNLWIGTTTGLSVIEPNGKIKNFSRTEGLNNEYIMCVYEDTDGNIWVGTDGGGINIIKDFEVIKLYTTEDKLAGNVVFKIMQDKNGIFWICTGTGISRFDGENFFNYNASCGMGTDSVFQMMFDYTGTVWMTSNRGISAVSFEEMNDLLNNDIIHLDPKFFNKNDGLRSGGITSTSLSMCDSLGRLWFTLIDGYAVYDPVKVKSNRTVPLVNIERIKIDDHQVNDSTGVVILPAGAKRVDIKYTGLSFISSEMMRFKYKLDGFDNDYSSLTSTRTVSYTNLKPGTYTFNVLASNSDGVWSEVPASVSFKQLPFFYQRPVFWGICFCFIVFFIYMIIRIRERQLKNTQLQLETMVQMKTVDLEIEKDNSDRLLKNILPDSIAKRLKQYGNTTIADRFEEVTVLFADIVGFTEITSKATAEEIVLALNSLFSRFDERAKKVGVEKIKTIGDAYMAVCGLPEMNINHADVMIQFAKGMYQDLAEYNATAAIPFKLRIGLNSGPVVAGVIGKTKFIYDMWGDTVNVASRMESLCKPGEILVTETVKQRARSLVSFNNEIEYDVKGKGKMRTFVAG